MEKEKHSLLQDSHPEGQVKMTIVKTQRSQVVSPFSRRRRRKGRWGGRRGSGGCNQSRLGANGTKINVKVESRRGHR